MSATESSRAASQPSARSRPEEDLHVELDWPIPAELAVGAGTAICVGGCCFHPRGTIARLSVVADGEDQPVIAHSMPRLDHFRERHPGLDPYAAGALSVDPESPADPQLRSYLSGFWAIVRIAPGEGQIELWLRAALADGAEAAVPLQRIRRTEHRLPPTRPPSDRLPAGRQRATPADPSSPPEPLVAICLATYNPPRDLLDRQLESIRAQTHRNWVCVISDDCSSPESYAALRNAIEGDSRFVLSRSPRRLGFYENFQRALRLAPARAEYVAMADQDDFWYPEKLSTLLGRIGSAQLVYSDARVVTRQGEAISDTWWSVRRNNHTDMLSLLVANSVTGAASLFRRDLLDRALPFPPGQFAHFHDHWIALVALALGEVAFVDRPLYDYVQHGGASLGHAAANRMAGPLERLRRRRDARERIRMWRMHYFVDICRLLQFATVLELRCRPQMRPAKLRALDRFMSADDSLISLAYLGLRGLRELFRSRPETLGAEWMLFCGFLWHRLLAATVRERPQSRLRLDAVPPPSLVQAPGRAAPAPGARVIAEKIAPLALTVSDRAPQRVNVLIPTIDLDHFFGGYIAKLNLARRLSERGLRVRVLTVDPLGRLPRNWKRTVQSYGGLAGIFDHVEVEFARESLGTEVSPADTFVATTWWTAHIADAAARSLGRPRFLYLIQEIESFTFPMGSYAALADQSYRFPHFAVFSSELLRGYFRAHAIGVYAGGPAAGDAASVAFQNAITAVTPPTPAQLSSRSTRRLLFYARPEPHAARNMFELGVLALARALEAGAFGGWELHGIGTVEAGREIGLAGGAKLGLLPRADQRAYAKLLPGYDVGLALMYTPHPSLVPIEMASAAMVTVTNSFENKTPEAMSAISPNLIAAEPSVEAVAAALGQAADRSAEHLRRVRASSVRWSTDWDVSFDEALVGRISQALDLAGP